ncbi:MAG: serine hydrolase domain-containing protein, partial [Acidobacteriota bacterium]
MRRRTYWNRVGSFVSILTLLVSLVFPPASAQQSDRITAIVPQLETTIAQALKATGVPGVAVAIVDRDKVVYIKGFGVREIGKPAAVDPDTVFQLASVSKPIASTVVAALVGDGVVRWDDPIIKHDPSFRLSDPWVTENVTIRDMFSHRSGLPDHAGDALEDMGYDRMAVIHRLRYQKLESSLRSTYKYTNFGLTAAAAAAAKASGKTWEDVSSERLYRRLGMNNTSSRYADYLAASNRASLHVEIDGKWVAKYQRNPQEQSPAGGVSSTVRDMAQWLRLQLAAGKFNGTEVIAAAALAETHRPQMVSRPAADPAKDHPDFYGLGWNVAYDDHGRVRLSHSGGFNLGAATTVALYPSEQLGIVVLSNAQPVGIPESIARSFF